MKKYYRILQSNPFLQDLIVEGKPILGGYIATKIDGCYYDFLNNNAQEVSLKDAIEGMEDLINKRDKELRITKDLLTSLKKDLEDNDPKQGSRWLEVATGEEFIIAQCAYNQYSLVCLKTGNRWAEPVSKENIIKVFGYSRSSFKQIAKK